MNASPFHTGERAVQARLGVRNRVEGIGVRVIRDHMPDQHRAFYARLPMLLVGALDDAGSAWASPVFGEPGFITSPDPKTLSVAARPLPGDPLEPYLGGERPLGVLGLEPHSRRRNRLSGRAVATAAGFDVHVIQSFGNCPKYIHARGFDRIGELGSTGSHRITRLETADRELIEAADTFFIATQHAGDHGERSYGADVSHRGGRPGFVLVESERSLIFPDFPGNNFFNTLGNLQCDPRAGLLFPDFTKGDLLYLTGFAEILWSDPTHHLFTAAERFVRFTLSYGWRSRHAMPIRWSDAEETR